MANFRNPGITIDYTPNSNVTAGDVIVVGSIVGVADHDITAEELGALTIEGVYNFPKASGSSTAIVQGTKLYWDAAEEVVTTTSGSNKVLGYAAEDAGDSDTDIDVKLARA